MSILQILTDLCSIRQSVKKKKHFCKYCVQYFSSKKVFVEHKMVFLKINGKMQSVNLLKQFLTNMSIAKKG